MKKMYKMMIVTLCAVLLVAASVMGTLAYLQMSTQTVTNTFTVGKVEITLQENYTAPGGTATTSTNGVSNIKLVPGTTIMKNPFVTVTAGSEVCWLFVKVENGLADIEDTSATVASQMATNGWTQLGTTSNIWYQKIDASEAAVTKNVFTTVKIDGKKVTQDGANGTKDIDNYQDKTIAITAYAVQAEGFDTAQDAWSATFGKPANS